MKVPALALIKIYILVITTIFFGINLNIKCRTINFTNNILESSHTIKPAFLVNEKWYLSEITIPGLTTKGGGPGRIRYEYPGKITLDLEKIIYKDEIGNNSIINANDAAKFKLIKSNRDPRFEGPNDSDEILLDPNKTEYTIYLSKNKINVS